MRQRVAIAIALLNEPSLIIADEPTTALDVTIQAQILFEAQKLCRELGTSLIWITHDLTVVAGLADRLCVMYAGRDVEQGTIDAVLDDPLCAFRDRCDFASTVCIEQPQLTRLDSDRSVRCFNPVTAGTARGSA